MQTESDLSSLLSTPQDIKERALAARYAPIVRFDAREPFLPLAAGYTIFRQNGPSSSFRQGYQVELAQEGHPAAEMAIEYAIWWDWDIGHLYDLEHVWVYVDAEGRVVSGEASWHGGYHNMRHDGPLALEDDRLVVYSEPGKHAFAPTPAWFKERRKSFKRSETSTLAGVSGVLRPTYIAGSVQVTPLKNRLVHTYLSQHGFEPSWDFSQVYHFAPEALVPWPALHDWMGARVNGCLEQLAREISPADYRFLRIGHRGAAAHAPDNTLLGIRRAAELGADAVEFDVRWTGDGQAVLAHDPYLIDADGRAWPIRRNTLADLRAIDLGEGERLPTFAEAIELCKDERLGAYVDLKEGYAIPTVITTLREQKVTGYSIVGSFGPDWLAEIKARAPEVVTSVLFGSPHVDAVGLARSAKANYVHPCWANPIGLLTPEWVACVREADLGIICWHDGRPGGVAALRRAGVDGICSDAPEMLDAQN